MYGLMAKSSVATLNICQILMRYSNSVINLVNLDQIHIRIEGFGPSQFLFLVIFHRIYFFPSSNEFDWKFPKPSRTKNATSQSKNSEPYLKMFWESKNYDATLNWIWINCVRAHSRLKSQVKRPGGCDMLWPEISTEMHMSVKSCFELVAPYDLTSCVYTLQNVAKALLKMHLDF